MVQIGDDGRVLAITFGQIPKKKGVRRNVGDSGVQLCR